ncbi:MAG TPA: hypothetical protein VF017_16015 [Thermoanaerobaculia bacterium]|nr:hypothetical protein [Thermoanaerobaculia bacterium]
MHRPSRAPRLGSLIFLASLAVSVLLPPLPALGQLVPSGLNRRASEGTVSELAFAAAADEDSSLWLVWQEATGTVSGGPVRVRHLRSSGLPFGPSQVVAQPGEPVEVAAALDPEAGFLTLWTERTSNNNVNLRALRQGTSASYVVNGSGNRLRTRPSISCRRDLGCVAVWLEYNATASPFAGHIWARRLDAFAQPVGQAFRVTDTPEPFFAAPSVDLASDGRSVVSWPAGRLVPGGYPGTFVVIQSPRARTFSASGTPLGPAASLDDLETFGDVAVDARWDEDGQIVAVWNQPFSHSNREFGVFARALDAFAGFRSNVVRLARGVAYAPSLRFLPLAGRFVAGWQDAPASNNLAGLAQALTLLIDANASPAGTPIPATQSAEALPFQLRLAAGERDTAWAVWPERGSGGTPGPLVVQRVFASGSPCIGFPPIPCAVMRGDERFVAWINYRDPRGVQFLAPPVPLTADTTGFTFTSAEVPEIVAKVLDGRDLNERFWVFYASLTDQEFSLVILDRATDNTRAYYNRQGRLASSADTGAFADPPGGAPAPPALEGLVGPRALATACPGTATSLCLLDSQYFVEVDWEDFQGATGQGQTVPATSIGGYFTFFDPANIELAVKLIDGRAVNGHFWVFYASLTSVPFTLRIKDAGGNVVAEYTNPSGNMASVADVEAF